MSNVERPGTVQPEHLEKLYPGVFTAYEFVLPSYGWMIARFEAVEDRLQSLQVFVATVSFAIPSAAKAVDSEISFQSWRFVLGALVFIALNVIGLLARHKGGVVLANPRILQEKWLRFDTWEFKKNAVFFAAEHFRQNEIHIRRKAQAAVWMTGLFALELVFLFAWVVTT